MGVVGHGPREVELASDVALAALADAFATSAVTGSRDQWAGVVGSLQRVIDVASAAQDAAIVRLAAIEPELLDDGTVVESHRALGHVALDAPAIVSGVLATSAVHAERRVRTAVRLAADGPVGSPTESGLGGLHAAMGSGRVDAYRASVVAEELEEAPAQVRAAVVAALDAHLATEDAAHLRRRCRRALARISPDLLRQRAVRARAESGLRRWADEPGVDRWEGTFPSEDAARAWAAIDALARQYVADAVCPTLERARAKALTDLVAGNATVETVLTVTVPAAAVGESAPMGAGLPDPQTPDSAALDAAHDPVGGMSGGGAARTPREWTSSRSPAPAAVSRWSCPAGGSPRPSGRRARSRRRVPPAHRCAPRRRGRRPVRHRHGRRARPLPSLAAAGRDRAGPRSTVPVPRVHRCGGVLRPRPRAPLAGRPHRREQPGLPVPAPPSHQATTRVEGRAGRRRRRDLDRPHRTGPRHRSRRRACTPSSCSDHRTRPRRPPRRARRAGRAPSCPTARTVTSSSSSSTSAPRHRGRAAGGATSATSTAAIAPRSFRSPGPRSSSPSGHRPRRRRRLTRGGHETDQPPF